MNILAILNELAADRSTKAKLAILQREKNNTLLRDVFKAAYDPTVNYYIKKIPAPKSALGVESSKFKIPLSQALGNLSVLSQRNLTGNDAIEYLADLLFVLTEDDATVLERVIQRDLRCDCTDTLAMKVWPGLVEEYPYMRCSLMKSAKVNTWDWGVGVFSQIKADGMFANLDHCGSAEDVVITSRAGSRFNTEKFKRIAAFAAMTPPGVRYTGEFLVKRDGVVLPREVGNGILNSVLKGGDFAPNEEPIYEVWDVIPLDMAKPSGRFEVPYSKRFNALLSFFNFNVDDPIHIIPTRVVHSLDEAYEHYFELVQNGFEGSIIKNPDGVWFDGTSKDQVKLKVECDVDLVIKGKTAGKGKRADTFGALIGHSSEGKVQVNVSGFKEDMLDEIHAMGDDINGMIMTIKFNNIMPADKNGIVSLFLPRFVELRFDKKTADSYERIVEQFEAAIGKKK